MALDFSGVTGFWPFLARGFLFTALYAGLGIAIGSMVGAVLAFARLSRSRIAVGVAIGVLELCRNLPFMVLLFLTFYLLPAIGIRLPAPVIGVAALGLYGGAYFSEIIRGAILSVPKGQMESARAAGLSRARALRSIIFPQMLGYLIPPATNQAVLVVKESSILSTITVMELTMAGQIVQGYTFAAVEVFLIVTALYWVLCIAVTRAGLYLESRLATGWSQAAHVTLKTFRS
jgi:polar amino acid transport system permease protein